MPPLTTRYAEEPTSVFHSRTVQGVIGLLEPGGLKTGHGEPTRFDLCPCLTTELVAWVIPARFGPRGQKFLVTSRNDGVCVCVCVCDCVLGLQVRTALCRRTGRLRRRHRHTTATGRWSGWWSGTWWWRCCSSPSSLRCSSSAATIVARDSASQTGTVHVQRGSASRPTDSIWAIDDCLEDKSEDHQNCYVFCCVVYTTSCTQWYAHTYGQFLKLNAGLGL